MPSNKNPFLHNPFKDAVIQAFKSWMHSKVHKPDEAHFHMNNAIYLKRRARIWEITNELSRPMNEQYRDEN